MWIIEVFKFGVYSLASSPAGFEGQEWMPAKFTMGSCLAARGLEILLEHYAIPSQSWLPVWDDTCDNMMALFLLVVANNPFFNKQRQPAYDVAASICDILIRQL